MTAFLPEHEINTSLIYQPNFQHKVKSAVKLIVN